MKSIIFLLLGLMLWGLWLPAHAAILLPENYGGSQQRDAPEYQFEQGLNIPGIPVDLSEAGPAEIVLWFFYLALGSAGILALIVIVVGGVQYMSGAIEPAQRSQARERIQRALMGLVLALGSFLFLVTINPDFVRLQNPRLPCNSCDCLARKNGGENILLVEGLNDDNCVVGEAFPGSVGFKVTTLEGSGDKELIKMYRDKTRGTSGNDTAYNNALREVVEWAAGKGYRTIGTDDSHATKCAAYCMLNHSDACNYRNISGAARDCVLTWYRITTKNNRTKQGTDWLCKPAGQDFWPDYDGQGGGSIKITDFFAGGGAICDGNKDGPSDDEVAKCPYLASYVEKIIALPLGDEDYTMCKCASFSNLSKTCVGENTILGL